MSNKSGTSSQVISLPRGGGALHGIGEKFSPDLFTGTGNFTVPIALPPGRNGFQPELNLVYSTGNGNGVFGLGWGLTIPGVSRKTSKGIPRYDDAQDVFILSGAEDLVPVEKEQQASEGETRYRTRYRPRTEGLFARIDRHRIIHKQSGLINDYWEVRSKDGLVSFYGTPHRPVGASQGWEDPAVIANPDPLKRGNIFAWKLTQTLDPFGNRIEYEYERDCGQEGPHQWDRLYLKRIRYADYGERENPQFLVTVTFEYENRPDPFSEYRPGFEIRMRKRCQSIQVRTHADQERLTRSYQLIYLDRRQDLNNLQQRLPLNGVSLLSQVRVMGHDGNLTEQLPPLEFGYTGFEPQGREFFPVEGQDLPARSLGNPELELADLFGNGLPDVLEMNGTVRYWRNLGNGQFDLPREMRDAPAGLQLADQGVQLIDAEGDGRIDLLVTTPGLSGYYPLQFGGLWNRRSFHRYDVAPSFDLEGPEVQLVDLTGDGVTDAIRSGSRLECFFNDPHEGWKENRWVERRDLKDFPNINFSDPRVKWGDMSGDGMQDILLVYDGNIEYWSNLGYGNWGQRVSMRNSPRFRYGYDPRRILVGDVDGDGLADLVYVDDRKVILWINQSGNGWSKPIEIKGTPPVSDFDAIRLVDLLGTGIGGVLWSADASGLSRSHLFFLDFTGGVKPYLLNEMDNHMGAVTRVGYKSSTEFYREDQQRWQTHWKTPLPFPVQVVAQVEVIDAISQGKLTTEYKYHHGYWDGAEREFRGFGRVEQLDTEVFEQYNQSGLHGEDIAFESLEDEERSQHFSPPLLTKTWFHLGPVGDEFGEWEEVNFSDEYWSGDPQVLKRPLGLQALLKHLPRRIKRDALRTMRGQILRTELYALDGTTRQKRPYTVTESLAGVAALPVGKPLPIEIDDWADWQKQVFFPHSLGQRVTQWERGDDPMTQFSFAGDYDNYGQPRSQIDIAVPRDRDYKQAVPASLPAPEPYLVTHLQIDYAQRDDSLHYIVDRVARTTTYEIENNGRDDIFTLKAKIESKGLDDPDHIIGQALNYYDGSSFQGLPLGKVGDYGAVVRTETLILTETIAKDAYGEIPPYLNSDTAPSWSPEYPSEFRNGLSPLTGYSFDKNTGHYFVTTGQQYDFHNPQVAARGLPMATQDALGRKTEIDYDTYQLLPTQVTDTAHLSTQADYDYRTLQPQQVTDPNGNRTRYAYTALGLLQSTAMIGKPGENEGDTDSVPSTRFEYDFLAFDDPQRQQPISVRTIRRVHHVNESDVDPAERDDTIETVEYSDGFGRLLQTRTQAEDITFGHSPFGDASLPADQSAPNQDAVGQAACPEGLPNVVVSGWQTYDNKGRVVEKYEPFFSCGWDYKPPADAEKGQKATMFYDPRGQVIRTVNPDGSEQRVIYGVPVNLYEPDYFNPTPWEIYTYDENDNAGSTHPQAAGSYRHHWHTPASAVVDALGRTILTVERNREKPTKRTDPLPPIEEYQTRSTYDIRGNLLTVTDALGRKAFSYVYDLTPKQEEEEEEEEEEGAPVLRIQQLDGGVRCIVLDVMGNEIERRDSKGALILQNYDRLDRPICLWARDKTGEAVTLRERLEYGDRSNVLLMTEAERKTSQAKNLLGELHHHYDEAGLLAFIEYDFKGNVLDKVRQVISNEAILSVFNTPPPNWEIPAFRIDWQPPSGTTLANHAVELLDETLYQTSCTYNAMNRVKLIRYPQDVEGNRKELRPRYNRAGILAEVKLGNTNYIRHIAYNAKGHPTLIAYGNGIMTRYVYDSQTFSLVRLRSERYTMPEQLTYHPMGAALQDFAYEYDLVGNILKINHREPDCGLPTPDLELSPNKDTLNRRFTYDPLYRLRSATGRECDTPPPPKPWDDGSKCHDVTKTRAYQEDYMYDSVGNMNQLKHTAQKGSFTRDFTLVPNTNRLQAMKVRGETYNYAFDVNGNMTGEVVSRHFEWDHSDRMRVFRNQVAGIQPTVHAHYVYDSNGQRVKKLVRKNNGALVEATVYIDEIFEHHFLNQVVETQENNYLHVMDDEKRIAILRVGRTFAPHDVSPSIQYSLGDHLGNCNHTINAKGTWVNQEEFTPYGETSFGAFSKKRYRFTNKEKDEESGLTYHGARYYVPWSGRWSSVESSIIKNPIVSSYLYAFSNPLRFVDPTGRFPDNPGGQIGIDQIKREIKEIEKAQRKLESAKEGLKRGLEHRKHLPVDVDSLVRELRDAEKDAQKKIQEAESTLRKIPREASPREADQSALRRRLKNAIESLKERLTRLRGGGGTGSRTSQLRSGLSRGSTGLWFAVEAYKQRHRIWQDIEMGLYKTGFGYIIINKALFRLSLRSKPAFSILSGEYPVGLTEKYISDVTSFERVEKGTRIGNEQYFWWKDRFGHWHLKRPKNRIKK